MSDGHHASCQRAKSIIHFTSYSDQKTGTVPSIVYYDKAGDVKGAGADTLRDSFIQDAEENEWLRVE